MWKWLAAAGLVGATAIALLMAEPTDVPLLVILADSLPGIWNNPFLSTESYADTVQSAIKGLLLVVIPWFATKLESTIRQVRFLDRTHLEEGCNFALQRFVTNSLFAFRAVRMSRFPSRNATCS